MADEPVAVGPDVVVFGVLCEHVHEEIGFCCWKSGEMLLGRHDYLAVVPVRVVSSTILWKYGVRKIGMKSRGHVPYLVVL